MIALGILNEATGIGNISAENGKYPDSFALIVFNSRPVTLKVQFGTAVV